MSMIGEINGDAHDKAMALMSFFMRSYNKTVDGVNKHTIAFARECSMKVCDDVMRELSVHHQKTYEGIERYEFWKSVKQHINLI